MGGVKRYGNQATQLAGSTGAQLAPGISDNVHADRMQGGVAVTSSGVRAIVFDAPYSSAPAVIATANSGTNVVVQAVSVTTTGFTLNAWTGSTGVQAGTVTFSWQAFGQT